MQQAVVDEALLAEIVRRLVEAVDPDQIILFGSRARGDAHGRSDLDLLIVKPSEERRHRRLRPVHHALWGIPVPVDVLWYTPEEVDEWSEVRFHVATRATKEGRLLYEKEQSRVRGHAGSQGGERLADSVPRP